MRRYIRNKGGSVGFQSDYTVPLQGPDGMVVMQTKQPAIVLKFEPLLGGRFGHTPWDMPTAYQAFGKVIGEVPSFANVKEHFDSEQGVTNNYLEAPVMVPIHGFDQGMRRHGLVKNDGTVVGDETRINPAYGLWVFDVDEFCRTNPHAKGREDEIEAWLDDPDRQRADYYVKVEPIVTLPSPNYLDLKGGGRGITLASRIADATREGFLDPDAVILYEKWNPRDKSEDIIEEMEKIKRERSGEAETSEVDAETVTA